MLINIRELYQAVKNAPVPTRRGQTCSIPIYNLVMKRTSDPNIPANDTIASFNITLTAQRYCTNPDNCWYEWLVNIEE